jgi:hypothetical protein
MPATVHVPLFQAARAKHSFDYAGLAFSEFERVHVIQPTDVDAMRIGIGVWLGPGIAVDGQVRVVHRYR